MEKKKKNDNKKIKNKIEDPQLEKQESTPETPDMGGSVLTPLKRLLVYGSNTLITTLLVFFIVGVVMTFSYNNHKRWDMSKDQIYSLSDQTQKVLKGLNQDVQLMVFYTRGSEFEQNSKTLLEQYTYYNSKQLKIEKIETNKNPMKARELGLTFPNCLVVMTQNRKEILNSPDEETLTNALIKVTQEGQKTVYFSTGHGERDSNDQQGTGLSKAREVLEKENYLIKELALYQEEEVPADCDCLIIAGPQQDYFEDDIMKIQNYLKKGGRLFIMLEPKRPIEVLKQFLDSYGVVVGDDLVIDMVSKAIGMEYYMPIVPQNQYGDHPIVKNFNLLTMYPFASSITLKKEHIPDVVFKTLAKTSPEPNSWAETSAMVKNAEISFDPKEDIPGPITLAVAGGMLFKEEPAQETTDTEEPPTPSDKKEEKKKSHKVEGRMVVISSVGFASNQALFFQGNKNMFLNSVSWLVEREDLISIRAKKSRMDPVMITDQQKNKVRFFSIFFLPGVVILAGVIMLWKRR